MKTSPVSRILATLMSVTVTLGVLNAVALYGRPVPSEPQAQPQIAGESTTFSAFASKYASLTDFM